MKKKILRQGADAWDEAECKAIIDELWALRESMLAMEAKLAPQLRASSPVIGPARAILHTISRCGKAIAGRCRNGWRRSDCLRLDAPSPMSWPTSTRCSASCID